MIRKLFNLYHGEERSSFLFAFLALICSLAFSSGLTLSEGLFLERIGANSLPIAYLFTAIIMFGFAFVLLHLTNRMKNSQIFLINLALGTLLYFYCFLQLKFNPTPNPTFWFVLKIFAFSTFYILVTCFWNFADQFHHFQGAKRLYTLFNTTLIVGSALGGFLVSFCLSYLSLTTLFLIIACLGLLSIFWFSVYHTKVKSKAVNLQNHEEVIHASSLTGFVKTLLLSRFVLLLVICESLEWLLSILTEFHYFSSFQKYFQATGANKHALTIFLGKSYALIYTANIIFGFFFYSRLVNKAGVQNVISIVPICFVSLFSVWVFTGGLLPAIAGLIVVEGLQYVIDDNNFNLLLNAVPSNIRDKVRITTESFLEPFGMLIGSLFLFLPHAISKITGLIVACCLLMLSLMIRSKYSKAVFLTLKEHVINFENKAKDWFSRLTKKEKQNIEYTLFTHFKDYEPTIQLTIFEILLSCYNDKTLSLVLQLIDNFNDRDKLKVLKILSSSPFHDHPETIEKLTSLLKPPISHFLKGKIKIYLAKREAYCLEDAIKDFNSSNASLMEKAAAMITIRKKKEEEPALIFYKSTKHQLEKWLKSRNTTEVLMGLTVLANDRDLKKEATLLNFLNHPNLEIVKKALKALLTAIDINCTRYTPILMNLLKKHHDSDIRCLCLKLLNIIQDPDSLETIIFCSRFFNSKEKQLIEQMVANMGTKGINILLTILESPEFPYNCRILTAKILHKLALEKLQKSYLTIIQKEFEKAHFYYYYGHSIQSHYPQLDLKLLQEILMQNFYSVVEFITHLIGYANNIAESDLIARSILSDNPKAIGYAIEILEKKCPEKTFASFKVLIDNLLTEEERFSLIEKKKDFNNDLHALLHDLQNSSLLADQIIANTLLTNFNNSQALS